MIPTAIAFGILRDLHASQRPQCYPPLLALLVEESQDLASGMLSPRLLMVHDTLGCSQDNKAELTRRKQTLDPLLKIGKLDVEARRDNTTLVDAAVQLNDDLAVAVVIDLLEFTYGEVISTCCWAVISGSGGSYRCSHASA